MPLVKKCSIVSVRLDKLNNLWKQVEAKELIIGFEEDDKGNVNSITIEDLLNHVITQDKKIEKLVNSHNDLTDKYNALLAAYKANAAKTAMQILDIEENN